METNEDCIHEVVVAVEAAVVVVVVVVLPPDHSQLMLLPFFKKSTSRNPSLSRNTDAMILWYKETVNKLPQRIVQFVLTET
jgi:hypothetical protein